MVLIKGSLQIQLVSMQMKKQSRNISAHKGMIQNNTRVIIRAN